MEAKDDTESKSARAQAPSASAAAPSNPSDVPDDVPDPDEDDLDDLDDMLDEFSAVKLDAGEVSGEPPAAASASVPRAESPGRAAKESQAKPELDFNDDEFARQLQAGMADLLGELEKPPEMQEQFEDMFKQMTAAAAADPQPEQGASASSSAKPATDAAAAAAADASFQDTIRRTMERMQTSGDQATAAAASDGGDDFMSEVFRQLSSGNFNPEGGEEDFSKMLMGMMEQLTNKDILYEPMKELDEKFPDWFDKNRDSTPPEDLKRYEEQRMLVKEIVARFEQSTYSDGNAADREYIVDRMQKMQAAGSPPADLVGDMASAQEALSAADDQCNPQ